MVDLGSDSDGDGDGDGGLVGASTQELVRENDRLRALLQEAKGRARARERGSPAVKRPRTVAQEREPRRELEAEASVSFDRLWCKFGSETV